MYQPGERVRLRLINASAMTYFNVRIPGLPMTVIQADGQNLRPVTVDELQIAVAETVDVIVSPGDGAWPIMAEAMDRSGFAFGSLTTDAELPAQPAKLRPRPRRAMADMGHGHSGHSDRPMATMDHADMNHAAEAPQGMDHGDMNHSDMDHSSMNHGNAALIKEPAWQPKTGPGVANVVDQPISRLSEPGTGLAGLDHRVLNYATLARRKPFTISGRRAAKSP